MFTELPGAAKREQRRERGGGRREKDILKNIQSL